MSGEAGSQPVGTEGAAPITPVAGTPIPGEQQGIASTGHGAAATDYDAVARERGWKPREEFDGTEDTWVGAEEFVKRQPLFEKIKGQNKKLKELEKTVEALAKHYNTNIEAARARAIVELKQERAEAIELGDVKAVEVIDEKIDNVKKMETVEAKSSLPAEVEQFMDDQKSWFHVDKEMTDFAISYNESYLKAHPGKLQESLDKTLEKVKLVYPEKFSNPRRGDPPPVEGEGGGGPGGKGGKYTMNRLSAEQKLVYAQLVTRHGQMTHDAYFKSLEEAGYLEK